ncbi:MAG: transketolase [Patescibacteria group bacterium]|nr:transketolase [Patescibacteria group bacterium]
MSHIHDDKVKKLEIIATNIRKDIIKMLFEAGSGHPAGSLGMADVFTALYFQIMHHKPKNPDWKGRDRLILSNGHICPVRYAAMAYAGYFPKKELMTLRKFGTRLQGHPERMRLPGLESTSGPLGAGLAQAAGLAYAAKMDGMRWRTYAVTSDGEHGAGPHWEAVLFAGKHRLANLTNIIDRNNIQIDGRTEDVMPLEPLRKKYESFNWHVIEVDGNDVRQIIEAVNIAKAITEKPTAIIAHNIPGRGVSFMEGDFRWHGKTPNADETDRALEELRALGDRLRSDHE